MKKINMNLTEQQIQKIRELSERTGLSFAELCRRGMDDYIASQEAKHPLIFTAHSWEPPPPPKKD